MSSTAGSNTLLFFDEQTLCAKASSLPMERVIQLQSTHGKQASLRVSPVTSQINREE